MFNKVLITGGAGYLGSVLTEALLNAGYQVTVYDNLYHRQSDHLWQFFTYPNFRFIPGDVTDFLTLLPCVQDADAIIHLAALVGYPACKMQPNLAQGVNQDSSKYIAAAARNDQYLMLASTVSVYGHQDGRICVESGMANPPSLYAHTKREAERAFLYQGNSTIFRFVTGFGLSPRMRWDNLPHDFMRMAVDKGTLELFQPNAVRQFVHVRDMARVFHYALLSYPKLKGEIYNVGSGINSLTKLELAMEIGLIQPLQITQVEGSDPEYRDGLVNFEKIEATGYKATWTLYEELPKVQAAYKGLVRREVPIVEHSVNGA